MIREDAHLAFLHSSVQFDGKLMPNERFLEWINERRNAVTVKVEKIKFSDLAKWNFENETGNLVHESGKFFSIEGINIRTNWGNVNAWSQPIINQPEIGFLGIITRRFHGILYFLMQAKIEPGNLNYVQLSPTLQATKSNYQKVHKGKTPLYLEYFNGEKQSTVLLDQLQSEQGARFFKKRNRNIIIEVKEEPEVYDDFCWLTLGQIKHFMHVDNLINMDTRTVISGINFGTYPLESINMLKHFIHYSSQEENSGWQFLISAMSGGHAKNSFEVIISWITNLKSKYELEVQRIPLNAVQHWKISDTEIHHVENKYFSVIGAEVSISNREVTKWCQPLIVSSQEGIIAFIVKRINGILHFLVQAKVEAGNFDILELAPTVQCLTGNYRKGVREYEVQFLDEVLDNSNNKILYKSMQSEEGGRFYQEQNLNMIIEVPETFTEVIPENYCWMTLNQLFTFIKFNNYLNIQARSLLAAISF